MLFKKEQKAQEEPSKVANTLSKIKEIGYTNYFLEPWSGELRFSSYREISEFMINTALYGDEKLFRDSVDAIKSVLYNNPEHEEANYLKFVCREFSSSNIDRYAALGLSVMLEVPEYEESASLLESARSFLGRNLRASQVSSVGVEAAILIMLENGSAEDRTKAFELLAHSDSTTKYKAVMLMDPAKHEDVKALGAMLGDQESYVAQSAASKLYSSLSKLRSVGFDAFAAQLFEAAVPKLLSSRVSGNRSSLEEQAGLLVAASMYASPKSLEAYSSGVSLLLGSEDPLAFGTGYSIAEKLLARSIIKKSSLPEGYAYKTKDLEFFRGAYLASAKSLGMCLTTSEIYHAYLTNIERMFSEGIISKKDYEKKLKLRADFEQKEEAARNTSAMLFGVFNAALPNRTNQQQGKYFRDISIISVDEYELFKNAIDSVMVSEIKWQSWLNHSLKKAATSRNPYRAYWNMLRFEAKANLRASKEAYTGSETSGIFDSYILEHLKALNIYSSVDRVNNRLYLMHETDPDSRFEAMERLAKATYESNKKIVEILSAYCKEHGVIPNEEYTKEYEALISDNMRTIEELRRICKK